ncbi:hypothetical protein, partial [Nonomuraea maheshkhaliensis]|uniref:hypothetical protein n=1 Tax=Nonomuraea maheshkhaliensis TaxID=419590 RepID=UPI0031F940A0
LPAARAVDAHAVRPEQARARTAPPPDYRTDAADFAAWLRERGRMAGAEQPAAEPPAPRRWWSRIRGLS